MNTIKISGPGMLVYKGKQIRLPATLNKVPDKDINLLKALTKAKSVEMEFLEEESVRLARMVNKVKSEELPEPNSIEEIEKTEIKVEDLFDSDDTLGSLLKNTDKE